jgi:hypothetical protein
VAACPLKKEKEKEKAETLLTQNEPAQGQERQISVCNLPEVTVAGKKAKDEGLACICEKRELTKATGS